MKYRPAPWIWSSRVDVAAFGGSAVVALAIVFVGHLTGISQGPLPDVAYLGLILGIDVAHVWSTLFRTYLDGDEVRRRKALYAMVPLASFALGVTLHAISRLAFWRALAYLAVFHFIRQQIGFVRIYAAHERIPRWERGLDEATLYAATIVPLLVWHAQPTRAFHWFVEGDFVAAPALVHALPVAKAIYAALLVAWMLRLGWRSWRMRVVPLGRAMVVSATAACWWVGIVANDSDLDFTATNVILHGAPYVVLLWHYAQARSTEAPNAAGSRIALAGVAVFVSVLLGIAFVEEMLWDRLVWHDRSWLFGGEDGGAPPVAWLEALVVPLLAVPQATHYLIDAVLWRRKDGGPAQARAMGFLR